MMLLTLLAACGGTPQPETPPIRDDEASAAAARLLCTAATEARLSCTSSGATATLDGGTVAFLATVDSFITLAPRSIGAGASATVVPGEAQLVLSLDVSVDGQALGAQTLTHAASDTDLEKARAAVLDETLQRWMVSRGLAVLDAVSGDPAAPGLASVGMKVPARSLGELQAWAGYPVLRGQGLDPSTGSKLGGGLGSMLAGLGPYVEGLDPGRLHVVQVNAILGGGGPPGDCGILPPTVMGPGASVSIVPLRGEVRVDGVVTGDICSLSEAVSWPLPQGGASLEWEQFVVLRAVPTEGDPGAPMEDAG